MNHAMPDDKDDQLLKELKLATMKRSAAQIVGPTLKVDNDRTKSRNISEFSGEADVAEWLEAKGFSMRYSILEQIRI